MTDRKPGSRSDKGPPPTEGGVARPASTREAMAMRRRDALAAKLQAEGLPEEEVRAQAMATMRENGRGDWRDG